MIPRLRSFRTISGALISVFPAFTPIAATASPVDCAILLCLAGGFPASVECAAAQAEMLRRVTPWPVEPPLQLWNCPMGGDAAGASVGAGTGSPDVRAYLEGIEVWQLSKQSTNSSGGREVQASAVRGDYDSAGNFQRTPVRPSSVPAWVNDQLRLRTGDSLAGEFGNFRGILIQTRDHQGRPSSEWIAY